MKANGMAVDLIAKYTGLSAEEIRELVNQEALHSEDAESKAL